VTPAAPSPWSATTQTGPSAPTSSGTSAVDWFDVAQTSDIDAARQAGTHSIGYANKPDKAEALADADAGAIITSLAPLALLARPLPN
jgi:hypothetical protein